MLMGIMVFHRLKARTGEKLDRKQEGIFGLVALRLLALAGMIALVAYFRNPRNLAFSAVPLPDWLRWIGVGPGVHDAVFALLDAPELGQKPHRYRSHPRASQPGYHWTLPVDQTSVLHVRRTCRRDGVLGNL
jgi:hypothetical protein